MQQRSRVLTASLVLVLSTAALAHSREPGTPPVPARADAPAQRNPRWAVPLVEPGLRNFHRVSPILYRGAQPTAQGMRALRRLGVRTVVSLRAFHGERQLVESAGLVYHRIPFAIWHPETSDMARFLEIVRDPQRQPVFVHCMRGADRTGLAVAVYRVCVEGWTPAEARQEMVDGGFSYETRFRQIERHLLAVDARSCAVRTAAALAGAGAVRAAD
jgi:protein tyrosine phosphatase (PTP) superfamily phosphohydrolase (DUF442 family)